MSDLQLGLIVIGILVVAGVYAFNRYQELQLRRRVESRFAQAPDDVLMQQPAAGAARGDGERIEPSLDPVPAQSAGAAAEEPRSERVAYTAVDPEPAAAPVAAAAPAAAEAAAPPDSAIDYVCSIEAPHPIDHGILERFAKAVHAIGKPVSVQGSNSHGGGWVSLPGGASGTITRVHAALQLADRSGAANRVQLSSLRDLALQFAAQARAQCHCGDIDQAAKIAADLDRFCSQVDISIGCNVVPRSSATLPGTKVRGLLESAGFALESSGRFVLRAEDGSVMLAAEDIQGQPLSPERLRSGSLTGLTLALDVPRVNAGARAFERMMELARHLAHKLDAKVVDDNRVELTDAGLKVIRQQLKSVHAAMEAQGIPAGGPLASRLFS